MCALLAHIHTFACTQSVLFSLFRRMTNVHNQRLCGWTLLMTIKCKRKFTYYENVYSTYVCVYEWVSHSSAIHFSINLNESKSIMCWNAWEWFPHSHFFCFFLTILHVLFAWESGFTWRDRQNKKNISWWKKSFINPIFMHGTKIDVM